jgi:translation elongation factor 1A GTP binding domain family
MKRRILEGGGEAVYLIGVADDGRPLGLPDGELLKALGVLREVARRAGATVYILRISEGIRGRLQRFW